MKVPIVRYRHISGIFINTDPNNPRVGILVDQNTWSPTSVDVTHYRCVREVEVPDEICGMIVDVATKLSDIKRVVVPILLNEPDRPPYILGHNAKFV